LFSFDAKGFDDDEPPKENGVEDAGLGAPPNRFVDVALEVDEPEPKENAPPPIVGLDSSSLLLTCCISLVGLSSILNSLSACLGGVTGRAGGCANMNGCLLDTSAPALPPPLKLKPREAGAAGAGEDDCPKLKAGAGFGAVGGVLGAAPKEKGVDGFTSFSFSAAGCPNENPSPPNRGFDGSTAGGVDTAGVPKLNGLGASRFGAFVAGAPKLNGLGASIDNDPEPPAPPTGSVGIPEGNKSGDGVD